MTTIEKIAVMQAYEDGETIQIYDSNFNTWIDTTSPVGWDWMHDRYRVKPEQKIRPYKDAEELIAAQKEHGPYIRRGESYYMLINFNNEYLKINSTDSGFLTVFLYHDLMIDFTWQDGTPCGIAEEE